jgi:hypothetical protein
MTPQPSTVGDGPCLRAAQPIDECPISNDRCRPWLSAFEGIISSIECFRLDRLAKHHKNVTGIKTKFEAQADLTLAQGQTAC